MCGKLQCFVQEGRGKSWRLCMAMVPLMAATGVGVSRIHDNMHHWDDVVVGGMIGMLLCNHLHLHTQTYTCTLKLTPAHSNLHLHTQTYTHMYTQTYTCALKLIHACHLYSVCSAVFNCCFGLVWSGAIIAAVCYLQYYPSPLSNGCSAPYCITNSPPEKLTPKRSTPSNGAGDDIV